MKQQFRLFRRGWGTFYCEDTASGKQESLHTRNKADAVRLIQAKNEAQQQPVINMQIARAYVSAADPAALTRTWQTVMDDMGKCKQGVTKERWKRAIAEKPFDLIRNRTLLETRAEHLIDVLAKGTVSTNIFLRRLHNCALDMNWLLAPIIPRRQWPAIHFQPKRAITIEEHRNIMADESNAELRDYYELLWHLGGSQSDMAELCAENIDWPTQTISFNRMKTGTAVVIRFGETVARILKPRAHMGHLFPQIASWKESDRAKAFFRRCLRVGISGVSLHSYRYSWAERAKIAGMPERYALEALGHKSIAVHRAYAKKAQVKIPALEDYENAVNATNVIQLPIPPAKLKEESATDQKMNVVSM